MIQNRPVVFSSLLLAFALVGCRPATPTNPSSGGSTSSESEPKKARPARVVSSRSANLAKILLKAKKPPIAGKKTTKAIKKPADEEVTGDLASLTGFFPQITSAGSLIEIFGAHFDRDDFVVQIGGEAATVVSKDAERAIIRVSQGGKVAVGRTVKGAFVADDSSELELQVLDSDEGFGAPRTEVDQGLLGNIYAIDDAVDELPSFNELGAPIGHIVVDQLNIPSYELTQSIAGRDEWFGIHFRGSLNIVEDGEYEFCLSAGDGAILFLDETTIVDNDGSHQTTEECQLVDVGAGEYSLDLLWYQGEAGELGLTLSWSKDGGSKAPIPPEAFFPPEDMYETLLIE